MSIWVVECRDEQMTVWNPTVFVGLSREDARHKRAEFLQRNDGFRARVREYVREDENHE